MLLSTTTNIGVDNSSSRLPAATQFNALTLTERSQLLRGNLTSVAVDSARVERRFNRWSSQSPFEADDFLDQRLHSDDMTADEFKTVLGASADDLQRVRGSRCDWMRQLENALSSQTFGRFDARLPGASAEQSEMYLLNAIQPILRSSRDSFLASLERLRQSRPQLGLDPATFAARWFGGFYPRALAMLGRTLVLELHIAGAEGRLEGNTPQERFQSFCDQLTNPEAIRALFSEYPVLARQVIVATRQRAEFGLEFADRLGRDWELICETFAGGASPGKLVCFGNDMGDCHRGGRHVLVAEFESGLKLVYKPRSLAVDTHFQQFVEWFNERGRHPSLRLLRLLDRGEYGWSEFVSAAPCHSQDEVHRFYQRQGAFIALLYVLQATDFHSENVIAAGEHPMLIDLESLFTPQQNPFEKVPRADQRIGEAFASSVLKSGLLPHGIWPYGEGEGIDISGLGTVVGQKTPYRVPYFADVGTDRMRLDRARQEMVPHNNRPTLAGQPVNLLDFRDALAEGFRSAYETLHEHRDELGAEDGPLARFAYDEVRPILRPTQNYAILLEESFHPDMMRDGLERDQLFDRLWIEVVSDPKLADVIRAERDDLQNGDMPIFAARPNSTDLWTSGGERIANYFPGSGLSAAKKCLDRLGPEDLDRQVWLLSASLATTITGPESSVNLESNRIVSLPSPSPTQADRLVDRALAIGERIRQLAVCSLDEANWLGLVLVGKRRTGIRPLQNDLYDGLPGVALFLAYLGERTGEARFTQLAEQSLRTARRYAAGQGSLAGSVGGFDGWGGYIYTLLHLAALWNRPEFLAEAENVTERLPGLVLRTTIDGVLGGTAGCLASLMALHRVCSSDCVLDVARICGDRLIETAKPMRSGVGWVLGDSARPLCGFAHGAAGIAWALLKLTAATGDVKYAALAEQAMQYERSQFCADIGNWADLRPHDPTSQLDRDSAGTIAAWCHGAAGIGLGRLASGLYSTDPRARTEIEVAIDTTLREGFGGNHSLCHGDLGNLELLMQASGVGDDPQLRSHVEQLTGRILDEMHATGWRCGVALHVEHPGLMTGLAGIGYGLLRVSAPESIPSVLTLDAPIVCNASPSRGAHFDAKYIDAEN
jgi:type 2 lantibiotic biosynthesis protein LanM